MFPGIRLLVFSQVFKAIKFYSFILILFRYAFSIYPCYKILKPEIMAYSKFSLLIWVPLINSIMTFLYIHPFSTRGNLYYYSLHFLHFLMDIFTLYMFTDPNANTCLTFLAFAIALTGCASAFSLLNIFHKKKYHGICVIYAH